MQYREKILNLIALGLFGFILLLLSLEPLPHTPAPDYRLPPMPPPPTQEIEIEPEVNKWDHFWLALEWKESKFDPNAVGDKNLKHHAYGPYQIRLPYWIDAVEFDPSLKGDFLQVLDKEYAKRVCIAYWKRYCPEALANEDWETLARIHNGGPRGHKKKSTIEYANDVLNYMEANLRRSGR